MGIDQGLLSAIQDHKAKIGGGHFLFSAENPAHPHKNTLNLTHEQTLAHLKGAGYNAHSVAGHYGAPERSIAVYDVSPEHAEHLHGLASRLGQDSSLYSTGKQHELRYHHGDKAGKSHYGQGTTWHQEKPKDFFTTLPGGQHHFTHSLDFDNLKPSGNLGKSESDICMSKEKFKEEHDKLLDVLKNPTDKKLKDEAKEQSAEMKEYGMAKSERLKLEHYSSQPDLKTIDPKFKGTGVDARTKGRETEHPHSFYYVGGTAPEDVVKNKSAHKYHTSVDTKEHPIYDMGTDEHGLVGQAIKENQGVVNMDMVHQKLKDSGYHGFKNSAHPTLKNVVGLYHPLNVEAYEKLR